MNINTINETLADSRGLTEEERDMVRSLHARAINVLRAANRTNPNTIDGVRRLHALAAVLERLEFLMQDAWKFERDRAKHTWWLRMPHCACPQIDNTDLAYYGRRIINMGCPVHGKIDEIKTNQT